MNATKRYLKTMYKLEKKCDNELYHAITRWNEHLKQWQQQQK